jgi:hypothetical protein
VLTSKLTDWRRSIEQLFRFNPGIPTDPAEIAKVRAEISVRRGAMETALLKGVRELEMIKAEAEAKRRSSAQFEGAYRTYRQAEIDWKFVNLSASRAPCAIAWPGAALRGGS